MRWRNDQDAVQRDLVIGVDVGGTTVKAALFDSDGLEYGASERPTPRHLGPDAVIATTIRRHRRAASAGTGGRASAGGGLVVPGVVDAEQGIAVYAANIGWRQLPYARSWRRQLACRWSWTTTCGPPGWPSSSWGAGRGLQEVLFVALGTGVAAAVITRGQVSPAPPAGPVNSATSRYFRKENGAPAGNADAPRPMPARPPCHADIPLPVASATFPPKTSSAGLQPATP